MKPRCKLKIAIIGAGFGGLGAAKYLSSAGFDDFTIFEQSNGLGGTWHDNRYPGAAVDTPSLIYSYSTEPKAWTRTHAQQAEVLEYLVEVAARRGLDRRCRFNTKVARIEWDERLRQYHVHTNVGEPELFDIVISAVGLLNVPNRPRFPGMDIFAGAILHTARWDQSINLEGLRVAVVGTGSSAAQIVPAVAKVAEHVYVFQREPGWVLPKTERLLEQHERDELAGGLRYRIKRARLIYSREQYQRGLKQFKPGSKINRWREESCRAHIKASLPGRPDLQEMVTPNFPFGGKRVVQSDDFYPSLMRANVTLVPRAVSLVTETGIVDADSQEFPVDLIVLATGFKASSFLSTLEVTGTGAADLHDVWGADPMALLGLMVPGFPNFFMIYGPNTNGGVILPHFEAQSRYIVSALKHMCRRNLRTLEAKPSIFRCYNAWLERQFVGSSIQTGNNYFKSTSGRVVTQWPSGPVSYTIATMLARRWTWRGTK